MIIKSYTEFILEDLLTSKVDTPTIASNISDLNQMSEDIKDYNQRKNELKRIYLQAKDELELVSELFNKKFIESKTTKKFTNPLFQEYSGVCDLDRKMSDIRKEMEQINISIKDKEKSMGTNPSMKDSLLKDIANKKTDTNNLIRRINDLKADSDRLYRNTLDKLEEMKKEITDKNKQITKDRSNIKT